jgi:precorrin-2 dehydrogenase/sirohydrochlorin ferrochelatase
VLPIVLGSQAGQVGLSGAGPAFERRREWILAGDCEPTIVDLETDLSGLKLLFVAGMASTEAAGLAQRARAAGVLVNVEDVPSACDFHVPAVVRRGDFTLSVSTGGRAPGLAKLVREWLDARFGPEWAGYLDQASDARLAWKAKGTASTELSRRTRELVSERSWLG